MGKTSSKIITYDNAVRRCEPEELQRFRGAFERLAPKGIDGSMDKMTFIREVFGESFPRPLAERIFEVISSSRKGSSITFKDFLCGLVIFSKGTSDERAAFVFSVYDTDKSGYVYQQNMRTILRATEGDDKKVQEAIERCFCEHEKISLEQFKTWAKTNASSTTITSWIFDNDASYYETTNDGDAYAPTTLSQNLASITNFSETDIADLQKKYWQMQGKSVDKETFANLFNALSAELVDTLFHVFDDNNDGTVDFREMVCGLSQCCRGDEETKLRFCFNLFDTDGDGALSREEMLAMVRAVWRVEDMLGSIEVSCDSGELSIGSPIGPPTVAFVSRENRANTMDASSNTEKGSRFKRSLSDAMLFNPDPMAILVDAAFNEFDLPSGGNISFDVYKAWVKKNPAAIQFLEAINKITTTDLGLKPVDAAEERKFIDQCFSEANRRGLKVDDTKFVISAQWWRLWRDYTSGTEGASDRPGEIDNSLLVEPKSGYRSKLKKGLMEDTDYVVLPDKVYKALASWYGGGPAFPRTVVAAGFEGTPMVELYPLSLFVRKTIPTAEERKALRKKKKVSQVSRQGFEVSCSRLATVGFLLKTVCINKDPKHARLWSLYDLSAPRLLSKIQQTLEDAQIVDGQDIFCEFQTENGEWPAEQELVVAEEVVKEDVPPGLTGLNNLGNTCFMNAALQCLSNTDALTIYMLRNYHLAEINTTNPLGHRGLIAKKYGDIVKQLWAGNASRIAPLKFRWTIGKLCPDFMTDAQQDSQEFLAYLLDGLHEDLNRVKDKPHVESKDSDGRPDSIVAEEGWQDYLKRNKSIIVDIFTGQTKSTLTCSSCKFVSVKFEAFTSLSLPLPVDPLRYISLTLYPRDGSQLPTDYVVSLPDPVKAEHVKNEVAKMAGISPKAIVLADVYAGYVFNYVRDNGSIGTNTYAFEVLPQPEQLPATAVSTELEAAPSEVATPEGTSASAKPAAVAQPCSIIYVAAMHRQLTRQELFFLNPYKSKLFGRPILLSVDFDTNTNENLYEMVWNRVKRLLRLEHPPSRSNAGDKNSSESAVVGEQIKDGDAPPNRYPFTLRVVTGNGTACGRCSWNKFCIGCEVPHWTDDTTKLDLKAGECLAIDWDLSVLSMYFSETVDKERNVHESTTAYIKMKNDPISLHKCLEWFTQEEKMEKDETWFCPKCKDFREASKKLDLWRMPPYLVVHLKRFQKYRGTTWVKSNKLVDIPLEGFDPTQFVADPMYGGGSSRNSSMATETPATPIPTPPPLLYDLYAVTNHFGSMSGGHYTASALRTEDGKWYDYNDGSVSPADDSAIICPAAYVLFFKRRAVDTSSLLPQFEGELPVVEVPSDDDDDGRNKKCVLL